MNTLTPREIVRELDRYIIGQADAKKAVAVALRNRYRRAMLPEDTAETVIPGGNHAGFGCYGPQNGDGEAGISATEQIQYTAEVITAFVQ